MINIGSGKVSIVFLPGTWWMHRGEGDGDEVIRLIADRLLQMFPPESVCLNIPIYEGRLMSDRAKSALSDMYEQFPGLRDGDQTLPCVAWSAGMQIARIMEELHGRRLWSVVGSMGGLPRTGVEYPEFFRILKLRFLVLFKGLMTNALGLPDKVIAEDIFGDDPCGIKSAPLFHCMGRSQVRESTAYILSGFGPGVKEWFAPPPLYGPIVALFFSKDVFVQGHENIYSGEEVRLSIVAPGAHGAFLRGSSPEMSHWALEVLKFATE